MTIKRNEELRHARLLEMLKYNKSTGIFTWRIRPSNRVRIGDQAGSVATKGYIVIRIDTVNYKAHRLAWFYVNGTWPTGEIDHRDGRTANNRWRNLRDGSKSLNMQNMKRATSRNKSGFLGVTTASNCPKFHARIRIKGVSTYLGIFDTPEQAHQCYLDAKRKHHEWNTL